MEGCGRGVCAWWRGVWWRCGRYLSCIKGIIYRHLSYIWTIAVPVPFSCAHIKDRTCLYRIAESLMAASEARVAIHRQEGLESRGRSRVQRGGGGYREGEEQGTERGRRRRRMWKRRTKRRKVQRVGAGGGRGGGRREGHHFKARCHVSRPVIALRDRQGFRRWLSLVSHGNLSRM